MNKKQWALLSIFSWILSFIFIGIDSLYSSCLNLLFISESALDFTDVWCIVNGEIYEPFIYLFGSLGIIFMILGWLEKK